MNLKKIIKKYNLEWNENKGLWLDPIEIMALTTLDVMEKWLIKCYPYEQTIISYSEMLSRKDDIYFKLGNSWYWDSYVEMAKEILGKNIKFIYSDKVNPLICKGKKYVVVIAPRLGDKIWDRDKDFNKREIFKELTGCKCPKIIRSKKS